MLIFHKLLLCHHPSDLGMNSCKRGKEEQERKKQFDSGSVSLHEKSALKATCCTGGAATL